MGVLVLFSCKYGFVRRGFFYRYVKFNVSVLENRYLIGNANTDMNDDRQKKIETGKLKLAKFLKKKNEKSKSIQKQSKEFSQFESSNVKNSDEKYETTDSSSTTSINTTKEKSEISLEEIAMDSIPVAESAFPTMEDTSDDGDQLLDAKQTALVSCMEQKISKYQEAMKQKDLIIQQLSEQLSCSMNATESANQVGTEVAEKLRTEINVLQLQMKEAAGMIQKQNSISNCKENIQGVSFTQVPSMCESSVQVELLSDDKSDKDLFKKENNYPSDIVAVAKRIDSLNVIAKLTESLVNISYKSINESSDFSPSKFQSFFLQRMNSAESDTTQVECSENESQMSDINFTEIVTGSFVKSKTDYSSIEKLCSYVVPKDLSLISDFLHNEMENINLSLNKLRPSPQGDEKLIEENKSFPSVPEVTAANESVMMRIENILQQKSKLETKVIQLKQLDKELVDVRAKHKSVERNFVCSDDNLLAEEPPLSCVSLLSLTDSEYKTEFTTDSEANFSRKVSLDSSRPAQDTDFCLKCDKFFELAKDKYDDHICLLKEAIESNLILEKNETLKKLESDIEQIKAEKESFHSQILKQKDSCQEQELKIQHIVNEYQQQITQLQECQNRRNIEKDELIQKINDLEKLLFETKKELHDAWNEKANIEITLQKQIADLVEEHQEDLEARHLTLSEQISQEKKKLEMDYSSSLNVLEKLHNDELEDLKKFHTKDLEDREMCLKREHSDAISQIEAAHSEECATYQKKIEHLLEEKCELLSKTTQEYETIIKKNHKALVMLCKQLRLKLYSHKKKVINESSNFANGELDLSITDAFDELSKNLENGIVKFLDQSYFSSGDNLEIFDETEYIQLESESLMCEKLLKKQNLFNKNNVQIVQHIDSEKQSVPKVSPSPDGSLEPEDIKLIHTETIKLQEEFQKDIAVYIEVNEQLRTDLFTLQTKNKELELHVKNLESKLHEKDKELSEKESQLTSLDNGSVKGCVASSQITSSDFRSWQVDVAQTNSRLLHVLSDLVKTFLDIEQDINRHLYEHGLISSRSGALGHQDDDTGHSVGSREDFASLSFGECPNLELAEDGPDLTPRAWDLFSAAGTYDHEIEGEDVVLGASRRLRLAVDHVLNLLTRALDNQQNQDLKLLLKRNEELSQELQDESKGRDALQIELVTAESTIRKLENEKQRLEDTITNLKENQDMLKRELTIERNKMNYLNQDKEAAKDEIETLKNQCELLASRLGDPERKLLQENSRLSSEKHNVQTNLSKERQSFLDRLQEMEIALDELNAEKDELMEKKCKEIRDLKAEMEAMEKQLHSNKRFIEEQAQEREQEREEYLKELNKMQEIVREKEKIQSNEAQLMKDIESLEQILRTRIEDHQNAMQKKDIVENELRQSVDKIRDLRDIIDELEKQLNIKTKVEAELCQKLSALTDAVTAQERRNSLLDEEIASSKSVSMSGDSTEQVENLKEKLKSQSQEIEEMSQNHTLLHELRGQIHFLEAKVEQRAKQLETYLSNSPVQSTDTSPNSSQESESLHLPCEDGWEMSPRSIHWLEVRRLEEKIGRLVHIDEELIKKNKELEQKFKRLESIHSEWELENAALQEKLSEQLIKVSELKSHIDEQKHRNVTPQKSQALNKKLEDLQEAYETALDSNKQLLSEIHETRYNFNIIKEETKKKDQLIESLQNSNFNLEQKVSQSIEKEIHEKNSAIANLNEENAEMKNQIESLKNKIISLNELLENSKQQVDSEQAQVETLLDELNNLSRENKRLEEDLNTVQHMMQQKEQELETLHEETDAQLKLEADIEALEKELENQKTIESDLRESLQKIETAFDTTNNVLKHEKQQWKQCMKDMEKSYLFEIDSLKKQLDFHKRNMDESSEDLDLTAIKNEIMEAVKVYNVNDSQGNKEYADLVYSILKKAIYSKVNQIQKEHETSLSSINESWQQKVDDELRYKNELESRCQKYKKDNLLLLEKMKEESDKLYSDQDLHWQSRLEEVKQSIRDSLHEKHEKELGFLQNKLEQVSQEKSLIEAKVKHLKQQVDKLNENLKTQKEKIRQEFLAEIPLIEQKIKEHHDMELQLVQEKYKQHVESLQLELNNELKKEKELENKHKNEISELHKLFETRWSSEVKRIMTSQMQELEKFTNNKEKNLEAVYNQLSTDYSDKLKALQKECTLQMAEERQKIQQELTHNFLEEKKSILLTKEQELRALAEALENEKRESKELKSLLQNKNFQNDWENEKYKLLKLHKKEISELKHKLQTKYEKLLQTQLQERDADMRTIEDTYNQRLEEVSDLLKIAKQAATGNIHSDSGSNRTTTPSSEVTSSDEACSSCQEDMLVGNKHLLVNKIHQDGQRILNLLHSPGLTTVAEKEAYMWLEEKTWIIEKLRSLNKDLFYQIDKSVNLKPIINNLCEEVLDARKRLNDFNQEIINLKKRCAKFEEEINESNAKMYILATNLNHQRKLNAELDSLLTTRTNETAELRRTLEETRLTAIDSIKSHSQNFYTNSYSSSYEVGQLRSAAVPNSSAEKFSMFLPEIESSSSLKLNKTEQMYPESKSMLELDEMQLSPERIPSQDEFKTLRRQDSYNHQDMVAIFNSSESPWNSIFEAKVHGLYWVYRKSLSQNKSLIYQKKYLLMLLRGFMFSEKLTLSFVNQIDKNIPELGNQSSAFATDCNLHGRQLFRSVALVAVAIQRMKYCVRRWRLFARVPSSDVVNAEIVSVYQSHRNVSPAMTPYGFNSFMSLPSGSVNENDLTPLGTNSSASSMSSRTGPKSKKKSGERGQLIEYVQRLNTLQKQLGLDNLR